MYNMYKPYKILMLATSMEYGGGETHILELSRYLKSNGIEIKIMSNGEELFEKEIRNSDIDHIYAPFHSRNIIDMLKSAKILKKAIKSYKPDIIHAHSRIPAFIASKICRKFKIPLVTTMHGTYKQSFLLKLFTHWGDYSLYVSGDIKDYWQKYYKLKPGYMTKTVNGINTELFNSETDSDICQELGIKPEEKIILTISRLEKRGGFDLAFSAVKLCEIAEDIYKREKNTRIIIVGDGENSDDIKKLSDEINAKLGFEYIIMTAKRTDAYKFCADCSVSVGVSRFALETLACRKPVIMCGGMGYLGRFTEENADKCESTNFTCRGFDYPDDINNVLLNEILFCLDENNKDIVEHDAQFGADLIREKYSVKKMADDAYSVYQKAVLKYKDYDFVLSGYYGSGNIGDDTLLFTIINNILQKKSDLKICILIKNPKKFQKLIDNYFCNITAKPRFNPLSVNKAIKNSKAHVFGGGTLITNTTSTRSLLYYLSLIKTARKYNKKIVLYANGIGPVYGKKNQEKVKAVLPYITLATIRDDDSYNNLIELGADKNKVYLTADEALTIRPTEQTSQTSQTSQTQQIEQIKQSGYLSEYKKDFKEFIKNDYIVINVRKWKTLGTDFLSGFSAAVGSICREHNLIPVYVVMQPKNDRYISEQLSMLSGKSYLADVAGNTEKVFAIIKSAKAVISMRLHMLEFAALFGIPMIGMSYDPKVRSFLESVFGRDNCGNYAIELKDFSKDILTEKFRVLMSNREISVNQINEAAEKLRKKAESNAELFLKAMEFEE